jgi:hypothetical protein
LNPKSKFFIQFIIVFNFKKNLDAVIVKKNEKILKKIIFKKNRSTEFQKEIKYILKVDRLNYLSSPIHFRRGLDVIKIIKKILKKN